MKIIIAVLIILLVLAGGGYFVWQNMSQNAQSVPTGNYKTAAVTLTGVMQPSRGDDYTYLLISAGKSTGIASQKIDLNQYAGKKVEVTGQYSGTTLYVDTVTIVP